jgi:hypothetical protein
LCLLTVYLLGRQKRFGDREIRSRLVGGAARQRVDAADGGVVDNALPFKSNALAARIEVRPARKNPSRPAGCYPM